MFVEAGGCQRVSWHAVLSCLRLQRPRTTDGSQRSHIFKSGVQMDTSSGSKSCTGAAAERGERPIQHRVDTVVFTMNHTSASWNSFTRDIRAHSLISVREVEVIKGLYKKPFSVIKHAANVPRLRYILKGEMQLC